ncbi:hypothetical protein [Sporosarcina koreensis]|uniref:hypothetical protein n=1 Tax=Sporosarcina koreensis TaxID=334735 RepID=UPI00058EBF5B|nr:hypothetical protein [Sporosarcina koreensis]
MSDRWYVPLLACLFLLLAGCADEKIETVTHTTEHPTAEEVLAEIPDADIFQFDGLIYQSGVDWVKEQSFTKKEAVGKILKQSDQVADFGDGTASRLPAGSIIYTVEEGGGFLLVETEGRLVNYLALVEG